MYTALKDMAEHYIGITYSIIVSRMAIFVASFHHLESVRNASQKMGKSEVRHWGKLQRQRQEEETSPVMLLTKVIRGYSNL